MEGAKRENTSLLNREVGNMYGELEWIRYEGSLNKD